MGINTIMDLKRKMATASAIMETLGNILARTKPQNTIVQQLRQHLAGMEREIFGFSMTNNLLCITMWNQVV